jgi:hypothetical protein
MARYKLLEGIDWERLNGRQIRLEVSAHWVIAVTREQEMIQLAVALRERPPAPAKLSKAKRAADEATHAAQT